MIIATPDSAAVLAWQASLLQPPAQDHQQWPDSQRRAPWWLLRQTLLEERPHPVWTSVRSVVLSSPGLTDAVVQRAVERGDFDHITHLRVASPVLSWSGVSSILSRAPIHTLDIRTLSGAWGPLSGRNLKHLAANIHTSGALRDLLEQDACQNLSVLSVFFLSPETSEWWSAPVIRRLKEIHLRGNPGEGFYGQGCAHLSAFSFTQAGNPVWLPTVDFSHLEKLSLSRSRISNAVLTRLGAQPWFSAVRRLDLSYTPLSSRGARWSHRPNALTHIDLSGTRTTARMLDGITNGCQLRVARITNSQCTADGVQRLLTGNAQTLQVVDISGTPAPAGLFSREEAFPALHTLSARGTALCARDFHGLLNGQHFPVLHSVDLGACSLIGECEVKASSPSLTNLWLSGAAIGTSATRLLGSPTLPSLHLLDLARATFEESPARQLVSPVQRDIHVLSLTVDHQWSSDDIESVLDSVAPSVLTLTVESKSQ